MAQLKEAIKPLAVSGTVIVMLLSIIGFFVVRDYKALDRNTEAVQNLNNSVIINTEAIKVKTTKDQEQDSKIIKLEEVTSRHTTDIEIIKSK